MPSEQQQMEDQISTLLLTGWRVETYDKFDEPNCQFHIIAPTGSVYRSDDIRFPPNDPYDEHVSYEMLTAARQKEQDLAEQLCALQVAYHWRYGRLVLSATHE